MRTERTVAVVLPAKKERRAIQEGRLLERVLEEIPSRYNPRLYISVGNAEDDFVNLIKDIESQDDRITALNLGNPDPRGLAYTYLFGLKQAMDDGSKMVIEMDCNGAHDPIYIREFLDRLEKGKQVVFSSRFSSGGKVEKYPIQRQIISRGGTLIANLLLGLGQYVNDMTSGYQAFKRGALADIFAALPIDEWISVTRGPGHFYQTEMRTLAIWRGHEFGIVPIVWGTERMEEPKTLPLKTVLKAFGSLLILKSKKSELIRK